MSRHPIQLSLTEAIERVCEGLRDVLEVLDEGGHPLAETIAAVESAGRLMDAARVRAAAPLARDTLAAERLGHASPTAAVATIAGITEKAARERLCVAAGITPDHSISGAPMPATHPEVGRALGAGELGLDAAVLVVRELDAVVSRVPGDELAAVERVMVCLATGNDPASGHPILPVSVDRLSTEIRQLSATIDPDGARPREERAQRRRAFRLGTQDADGLIPVSGRLVPEVGSLLAGMMEAHRRSPRFVDVTDEALMIDAEGDAASLRGTSLGDPRTPDQRRHDALAEILIAASASEGAPRLDGQPVTVVVTVTESDLTAPDALDGDPIGVMSGSRFPVSRAQVERFVDAGGSRTVTLDGTGAVVGISSIQRCFTPTQRLAIAARDGHRCLAPGCTSPHFSLQVHHVIPDRHGGPTTTDNGILLCYWHHRRVDDGPWEYRMWGGLPEIRGPGVPEWTAARASMRAAA